MPPKKNRADKKAVQRIFKEGKFINSPNLTFKFVIADGTEKRISVIVPKSVAKKAVERNFLRRRAYSVLGKHTDQFPAGLLGVFIFKKNQSDIHIIVNEIENILNKIN